MDLVVADKKIEGDITLKDYKNHLSFSWGFPAFIIYYMFAIAAAVFQLAPSFILANWTGMNLED